MVLTRLVLEGRCDKAIYPLPRTPEGPIVKVTYRALNGGSYGVTKASPERFYLCAVKEDGPARTEEGAYWFVRAVYERLKKAVWYYFEPGRSLIVFPPPEDGEAIMVYWEDRGYEKSSKPLSAA